MEKLSVKDKLSIGLQKIDTVDTRIVKALRKKVNIATQIMGEELKEWI